MKLNLFNGIERISEGAQFSFADSNTILELFAAEEREREQAAHQALQWARQAKAKANLFFFMKRKDGLLLRSGLLFSLSSLFNQINSFSLSIKGVD